MSGEQEGGEQDVTYGEYRFASPPAGTPPSLPSGNDPLLLAEARSQGWNWGGFLVPYLWLLGHGRVTWGMILLLSSMLPIAGMLHVVILPIASIYLGMNGSEMAWRHAAYRSIADLVEEEREWTRWGWVCAALFVLALIGMLLYVTLFLDEAMRIAEEYYGT